MTILISETIILYLTYKVKLFFKKSHFLLLIIFIRYDIILINY